MRRPFGFASFSSGLCLLLLVCQVAHAQSFESGPRPRPVITQAVDDNKRVTLRGNTRPEANMENDRGRVHDEFRLEHMMLQLKRSPDSEAALEQFLTALQTPGSPNFHKWISAQEFGTRFGVAPQDLDKVTDWLQRYHLKVNVVYPSAMLIDFSGTANEVRRAFGIDIHKFDVNGEHHFANTNDPGIPAALAPTVAGIVSIHNFAPHALHLMHRSSASFTFSGSSGPTYALVPADLATIYNLNPLFAAGYAGQGQTIVLIEDTDVFSASDWNIFRSTLGLSSYTSASFASVHPAPSTGPNNCAAPGVIAPNDAEAILDAEWASAAAPGAAIEMAACADSTTTFGGLIAMQNILNGQNPPPALMSISYGQCETVNGAAANAAYNSAYQLAVAEGVSVFVAAGDSGAAGCDNSAAAATHGIGVNAFASTPYNVAVGGTDFSDTLNSTNSTYWGATNSSTFGSALSYIPEIPWNNSCAGALLSQFEGFSVPYGPTSLCNDGFLGTLLQTTVAGGGGPSACATGTPSISSVVSGSCQGWPKPSWQSVLGNPNDGVRDTPDVSLFAADGLWSHYYVFCWSDTANGGAACSGAPSGWSGAGGTSFASPIMAGIQALVNQRTGSRQGNPSPAYYQLAAAEYGSGGSSSCNSTNGNAISSACVFNDVTQGDMAVNCTGHANCFRDGAPAGVLSTANNSYKPAYATSTGWDFATGIGSVNAFNLVNNWPGSTAIPAFSLSASPNSVTLTQGQSGTSSITVNPQNGFTGTVSLSASGLPSGVTASFSPASTATSSTLTLKASSTAAAGTFNVAITGTSGSLTNSVLVSLTVNAIPQPNFTLSASPASLTFTQGASGNSTITVSPQNGFNGSVSLSASGLPSGVTASFSPASTSSTSTLTLSASGTALTGAATVTITGTSGNLTNITTISLTVTLGAPVSVLPQGWTDIDIGAPGAAGSANYANNTFTVQGAGSQIFGSADAFNFVYQPLSGDGSIVARLLGIQGGSGNATAGVMIRNTLDPNSANAKTADWPTFSGIFFDLRAIAGGATTEPGSFSTRAPYWIEISRAGSSFTSSVSLDGVNWMQIGTVQTINMGSTVFVGLAVNSGNTSPATAFFDNVSVNSAASPAPVISSLSSTTGSVGSQVIINGSNFGPAQGNSLVFLNGGPVTVNIWTATSINITIPAGAKSGPLVVSVAPTMDDSNPVTFTVTTQPLPAGWLDQDVGATGVVGNASFASSTFTVNGAGAQISGSADAFHFVYQPMTGDGTIVARLTALVGGAQNASAGVMIRNTLDASSPNASIADWRALGAFFFDVRTVPGGNTSQPGSLSVATPYWIKVSRSGNTLSGFASVDGVTWVQVASSQTINMNQTVYVGLAVTSGSTTALATAFFDNVSIGAALPPSFTLLATPATLTLTQGTTGTSTITVAPQNGFNGNVTFGASGLPGGVTASFNPTNSASGSTLTVTASNAATTGTVTVTVTGTSGSLTASTTVSLTVNPIPPSFTLSASPSSLTLTQGTSGTSTISVTPQNGFNSSVGFSASGLPTGVTASFSPASSTTGSTLTLTAGSSATTGTVTVTVTGTSGSLTASSTLSLTVNSIPASFTLSASPSSLTLTQGTSGTSTISVTPQNGFNSSVSFSASGLPNGVTASFSPASSTAGSTLTLTAGSSATTGTVMVTVTGTSGSLTASTTLSLTVNSIPTSFTLSASPSSLTLMQGTSATTTISVTPQNGFNSNVSLTASNLPSGVTASFSPASTGTTSILTLTASGTATTGTVTFNVTGTSGSLTASTSVSLTVNAALIPSFTLSASPNSLGVAQGTSRTTSLSVVPQNGFNSSVSFSASGLPAGVSASFNPVSSTSTSTLTLTASSTATTGTATVTVTGTSGSLTSSATVLLTVTASTPGLPPGWNDADVGATGVAGKATYANDVFTVSGAGAQIFGTVDAFNFVSQPLSGDGYIVARLLALQGGSTNASAGVMIRDTLDPASDNAKVAEWRSLSGIFFDLRPTAGGSTSQPGSIKVVAPYWLKISRTGNTFSGYVSLDGVNWVQLATSQTITMGSLVNIGLAVTSGSTTASATAFFDNVSVTSAGSPAPAITGVSATTGPVGSQVVISGSGFGATQGSSVVLLHGTATLINTWSDSSINITLPAAAASGPLAVSVAPGMNDSNPVTFTVTSQPLPAGWLDQDVGATGVLGNATFASGTFTVNGAGTQIFGSADAFHFVYQPMTGDGTIVARLTAALGGAQNVAAGVMIRNTLDAASPNAKIADWRALGAFFFDVRTAPGGDTSEPGSLTATTPYWIKVSRSGNTLSGFASPDGVTWVQVGSSQTITMNQTVYVGLAVTSGSTTGAVTTFFDNVAITNP